MAETQDHTLGGETQSEQDINERKEDFRQPQQNMEATSQSEDSSRTPRTEDDDTPKDVAPEPQSEPDYFGSMANRKSSSGFLASLTASNISSPLQSTYASSASLQSSGDHATGQINTPQADGLAAKLEAAHVSQMLEPIPAADSPSRQDTDGLRNDVPPYPDQSLAALHSQTTTLPYAYLKARNSDYGKNSTAASPGWSSGRLSATASISADHTPLQSPGLFQPKPRFASSMTQPTAPSLLHPTHRAHITKETNKLIKDFDQVTGNKIMNNYEVFEKLGTGSYGAVKHARNLVTSEDVAIKILKRTGRKGRLGGKHESAEDKIKKEVAVLKKARHPQIVSLLEVIDDPSAQKVYLVLEYVERGEIIWRTETSRDVARFEMERASRELAGPVDDHIEAGLLTRFNDEAEKKEASSPDSREGASTDRRLDGHLGLQKISANDPNEAGLDLRSVNDLVHGWSNEVGGNESDAEERRRAHSATRHGHYGSPDALETPRAMDTKWNPSTEAFPDIAAALAGSQYGSYMDEEEHWTVEENGFKYVPCMTMAQAREAFRDTVLGLEYLHYHGIIHRDIKPANLLWTKEYRVKISDFGVSYVGQPIRNNQPEPVHRDFDEDRELAKTVGTPAFYAPELCDPGKWDVSSKDRRKVTGQIDIWALGVTLYAMIYGRLPFFDESDEWSMYDRIARQEAFLSSKRLHGVDEHGRASPDKRKPNVIAYEEVDDVLKDLLKRLLAKDPMKRATIREIKVHPWVLYGLDDPERWIHDTDPSLLSEGKIEVSNRDLEVAIAPLNLVDRIKHQLKRIGSVVTRGRESRRRADSGATKEGSGSNSSRSTTIDRDARRQSLRGDEQIYSALKASREAYDHPLSQSVMASPVVERSEPVFVPPIAHLEMPVASGTASAPRPAIGDRQESTTESTRTIRPHTRTNSIAMPLAPPISEDGGPRDPESAASSSSALSALLGVASRRLASTITRRDRAGSSRDTSSHSSRSSSVENMANASYEDPHAFPSVALSPVMAAGQVDYGSGDSMHGQGFEYGPSNPRNESSPSAFARARAQNFRKMISEHQQATAQSPHAVDSVPERMDRCPPSPDDILAQRARASTEPRSSAYASTGPSGSSAEDVYALSESTSYPSMPSTATSTSQPDHGSAMLQTADTITASTYGKHVGSSRDRDVSPFAIAAPNPHRRHPSGTASPSRRYDHAAGTHQSQEAKPFPTHGANPPTAMRTATSDEVTLHPPLDEEEGYIGDGDNNGDGEDDEGSDDEGIVMGGRR